MRWSLQETVQLTCEGAIRAAAKPTKETRVNATKNFMLEERRLKQRYLFDCVWRGDASHSAKKWPGFIDCLRWPGTEDRVLST